MNRKVSGSNRGRFLWQHNNRVSQCWRRKTQAASVARATGKGRWLNLFNRFSYGFINTDHKILSKKKNLIKPWYEYKIPMISVGRYLNNISVWQNGKNNITFRTFASRIVREYITVQTWFFLAEYTPWKYVWSLMAHLESVVWCWGKKAAKLCGYSWFRGVKLSLLKPPYLCIITAESEIGCDIGKVHWNV